MPQSMGSQRVRHDWATEQQQHDRVSCNYEDKHATATYNNMDESQTYCLVKEAKHKRNVLFGFIYIMMKNKQNQSMV